MLGDSGWGERVPERYCPYIGPITPDGQITLLYDGSYMLMLQLKGLPYELATLGDRTARAEMFDLLLKCIADPRLIVHSHLVRHQSVTPSPMPMRKPGFGRDYADAYERELLKGKLWRNDWFLTLVLRPGNEGKRWFRRSRQERAAPFISLDAEMVQHLDNAALDVERTMHQCAPRRIGYRDMPPADFDVWGKVWDPDMGEQPNRYMEVAEKLHLIRTGHEIAIAEDRGTMGSAVYPDQVTISPRRTAFDLGLPDFPRIGSAMGFKHYPEHTRPGMLNALLSAPYSLVIGQSFHFSDRILSHRAAQQKLDQMLNVDDASADEMRESMKEAARGNREQKGMHNLTLLVFAEDAASLNRNLADARNRASEFGAANIVRERRGLEGAYWTVMPGVTAYRMRKGKISSLDFANLSSFEGYPEGQRSGHWGPAIKRFRTNGGTAYDFVPHVGEVAHTLFTGWTRSGKTTAMADLAGCLGPVMGPDGLRLLFDKDQSSRLMIEHEGGRYLVFRRQRPSGVAPLFWPNTPQNHGALFRILKGAIERDGRGIMPRDKEHGLQRGIARQFKLPPEKRTFAGIREFLGYDDPNGVGARFEPYCRGGPLGWLLDNDEHLIDLDSSPAGFFGFDWTELLPKAEDLSDDDGATGILASVLMHELRARMDGRRIALVVDEGKFFLDPLGDLLEDASLTGGKYELMLWLACQHPLHILNHPRGPSIVGQMATKISWHDPNADASYVTGLGYSPAALRQIKREMGIKGARRMLIWRDGEPVIAEYDLSPLPDKLAVLSSRPRTVRMLEKIKAEMPDADDGERHREFARRIRLAREAVAA